MIRAIVAGFFGYVVTVICVMACIAAVWYAMGNEFAFAGESTLASIEWSISMLVSGLLAAVVGGAVSAKIGGRKAGLAVRVLIGLILVLGGLTAISQLNAPPPPPLPEGLTVQDLTFMEAGQYAVSPMWYNVAIVFVGAIGVWIGGRICLPTAQAQNAEASSSPS